MKQILVILIAAIVLFASCKESGTDSKGKIKKVNLGLKNDNDSLSYFIGLYFARNLKGSPDIPKDLDYKLIAKAFEDVIKKDTIYVNPMDVSNFFEKYFKKIQVKKGKDNKIEGDKFLAENKNKPGVQTLPSGLQYIVLREGTGPVPTEKDTVKAHYAGTLINGKEFDSSYKQGMPATFPVQVLIPGWKEALTKMKVGSKWKLFIPGNLAYGENPPQGSIIGPNATLIFEMELLEIVKKEPAKAQPVVKKK